MSSLETNTKHPSPRGPKESSEGVEVDLAGENSRNANPA
jgi:hypothetical protein